MIALKTVSMIVSVLCLIYVWKEGGIMYERCALSECELVTMRCVWNLKERATAFNVINMLAEDYGMQYKETTVYTFLKKLREKGFVKTRRQGVTYYIPLVDEESYKKEMAKKLVNFWFNGDAAGALKAVAEGEHLTRKQAREVRATLDVCVTGKNPDGE